MSKIIMLVTNGFEEIEVVSVADILRRADIQCDICSMNEFNNSINEDNINGIINNLKNNNVNNIYITGSHDITIKADLSLFCFINANAAEAKKLSEIYDRVSETYDAVYLPGGIPGSNNLRDNDHVINIIKSFHAKNKIVSAICAAPKVLERAEVLQGKKATFYPNSIENEQGLNYTKEDVERDGNVITGKAAGAAAQFAFELVSALAGKEEADRIKTAMYY